MNLGRSDDHARDFDGSCACGRDHSNKFEGGAEDRPVARANEKPVPALDAALWRDPNWPEGFYWSEAEGCPVYSPQREDGSGERPVKERWRKRSGGEVVTAAHPRDLAMNRPFFRLLWIGRGGFGLVWRGVEHQFYRDLDGSMGKRLTHTAMPWLRCVAESDA